jgi:hypothetical protein
VTRRFADVHGFFSVQDLSADYALTVWADAATEASASGETPTSEYRWQLTCLPDGRNRGGKGLSDDPYSARWAGILAGVESLQGAIRKGSRSIGDFGLEIRLPGIGGNGDQLLRAAPRKLQECLQAFSRVHVITLEGAGGK